MAQYTRFEIYIPVVYTIMEQDARSGQKQPVVHALDDRLLREFIEEAMSEYSGLTQANPLAPALFKGWWRPGEGRNVSVDYLTYLFGLVRIDKSENAKEFFEEWSRKFAAAEQQDVILLIYYPVQTIGDFF
jgi:hypothetical protein